MISCLLFITTYNISVAYFHNLNGKILTVQCKTSYLRFQWLNKGSTITSTKVYLLNGQYVKTGGYDKQSTKLCGKWPPQYSFSEFADILLIVCAGSHE